MGSSIDLRGQFRILGSAPTDTNEATIFTAGKGFPVANELWITNKTGSAVNVTFKWGDGSTDYPLIDTYSLAARDHIHEEIFVPMREGYTLKITSGTANGATFSVAIVEGGSLARTNLPYRDRSCRPGRSYLADGRRVFRHGLRTHWRRHDTAISVEREPIGQGVSRHCPHGRRCPGWVCLAF